MDLGTTYIGKSLDGIEPTSSQGTQIFADELTVVVTASRIDWDSFYNNYLATSQAISLTGIALLTSFAVFENLYNWKGYDPTVALSEAAYVGTKVLADLDPGSAPSTIFGKVINVAPEVINLLEEYGNSDTVTAAQVASETLQGVTLTNQTFIYALDGSLYDSGGKLTIDSTSSLNIDPTSQITLGENATLGISSYSTVNLTNSSDIKIDSGSMLIESSQLDLTDDYSFTNEGVCSITYSSVWQNSLSSDYSSTNYGGLYIYDSSWMFSEDTDYGYSWGVYENSTYYSEGEFDSGDDFWDFFC